MNKRGGGGAKGSGEKGVESTHMCFSLRRSISRIVVPSHHPLLSLQRTVSQSYTHLPFPPLFSLSLSPSVSLPFPPLSVSLSSLPLVPVAGDGMVAPWSAPQRKTIHCAFDPNAGDAQTKVSVSFLTKDHTDIYTGFCLRMLASLLTESASSPFYLALIDSGIAPVRSGSWRQ